MSKRAKAGEEVPVSHPPPDHFVTAYGKLESSPMVTRRFKGIRELLAWQKKNPNSGSFYVEFMGDGR
jgi:hypothetical protein